MEKKFLVSRLNLSTDIQKVLNVVDPVNPATGRRDGLLDRMTAINLSQSERDLIASIMVKMPAGQRSQMSDEDRIAMLPSRYNSTLVDADAVKEVFSSIMEDAGKELEQDGKNLGTPAPAPAGAPAGAGASE